MSELIMPPAWVPDALCAQVDPELWFPEKGGSPRAAKAICNGDPRRGTQPCDLRDRCLEWALGVTERLQGVWGGMSEGERRQVRAEREAA